MRYGTEFGVVVAAVMVVACDDASNVSVGIDSLAGAGTAGETITGDGAGGGGGAPTGGAAQADTGGTVSAGGCAAPCPNCVAYGYRTQGTLKGGFGTLVDTVGSAISTFTETPDNWCVSGNVIQVPIVNGSYDYDAWGVAIGWYLNQEQLTNGCLGDYAPADLSAFARIVVAIAGTTDASLRIQLGVEDPDSGASKIYCAQLPATGTGDAGIALSSLVECSQAGREPFDPATMRPVAMAVAVLTDIYAAHSFDLCMTPFVFE